MYDIYNIIEIYPQSKLDKHRKLNSSTRFILSKIIYIPVLAKIFFED